MAIVSRLRSVWDAGEEGDEARRRDAPPSALFECPQCDVVYIASDKETCSNCNGPVEEVRSTLRTDNGAN